MTLIRSNPQYKYERARVIHERYNPSGKSLDEIETVFRQVDLLANTINERTGGQLQAEELHLWVIGQAASPEALADVDPVALYEEMETVFLTHPPLIYGPETLRVLRTLQDQGHTTSLLSNTAFIKGRTLRKAFPALGLAFDFELFSDEEGVSKPNSVFFERMLARVPVSRHDVLHVGDNPVADGQGAARVGLPHLLINVNRQGIEHLLRLT
ncbi:putative hydrolase of the HAD superfamily [Dinghuibacter silviterrae]|uniref:Putative hydrolase of the HAD superfamily n=2 Tax=Dinghuibacter silviterrae TaxID=1539049 RepID=A0A4R8DS13_9BACT|nr:putative hydrolase of the HAD superfamily [Dinghuibacter silviterrae]